MPNLKSQVGLELQILDNQMDEAFWKNDLHNYFKTLAKVEILEAELRGEV